MHNRHLSFLIILTASICFIGCHQANRPKPQVRSATGKLSYFPPYIRSAKSWSGHNFMVDGIPVKPTKKVPESDLLKHVGKIVTVKGEWNPGKEWKPNAEEVAQHPISDKWPVIRGDGIMASELTSPTQENSAQQVAPAERATVD